MQTQNRFFDDLARLMGGAAGALSGVRNEVEGMFRQQLERLLTNMDLVSREMFDVLHAMVQTARNSQESLEQRVAALEARKKGVRRPSPQRLSRRRAAANLRRRQRWSRAR